MTVEATLLMPMVICVMVLICYFSFFLYGKCVLSQDSYILAFRASRETDRGMAGDPQGYVSEHSGEVLGKKYFGSSFPRLETDILGKEITVKGSAEAKHSAMGSFFLKPKGSYGYEVSEKAKKRDYPGHIRRTKRLLDLGK